MATTDKNNKVVLGWLVNKGEQQAALAAIAGVEAGYLKLGKSAETSLQKTRTHFEQSKRQSEELRRETDQTTATAAKLNVELEKLARVDALGRVSSDFGAARRQGVDLDTALQKVVADLKALGATEAEIQRVARSLRDVAQAADSIPEPSLEQLSGDFGGGGGGTSGGTSGRRNLGRLGSQIRGLPSMPIAGALTSDAIGNLLRVSGSEFAGVAAGIGGLSVALRLLADHIEATSRAIKEELETRDAVIDAIQLQTRDQAQAAVAQAEQDRARAQARIADAQRRQQESIEQGLGGIGGILTPSALLDTAGELKAYNEYIQQQESIVRVAGITIDTYNEQIAAGGTAIGDTIAFQQHLIEVIEEMGKEAEEAAQEAARLGEAEARLSEQRKEAERDRQIQANLTAAEDAGEIYRTEAQLREGSADQARDYIHALQVQTSALRESRNALEASGDKSETAARQIEEWNRQINNNEAFVTRLLLTMLPYLDALEAQAAAQQQLVDAGRAAVDAEKERVEALKAVIQEETRHADVLAQIEATARAAIARAESERQTALDRAETQASDALVKAQERKRDDELRNELRHIDALRKIRENFARDSRKAAASLDANALQQAIEARKQARKDESREYKNRQREIDKTLQDTTRDIQRNLDQQRTEIEQRYNEQLQSAVSAANQALAIENAKYSAEIAIRQQAYNIALAQAQAYLETLSQIGASQGRNVITSDQYQTITLTAEQAQAYIQAQQPATSLDRGTRYVQQDMNARLHTGEGVLNRVQNRNYNNQRATTIEVNNSFNNSDMTEAQFEQTLIRVLERQG